MIKTKGAALSRDDEEDTAETRPNQDLVDTGPVAARQPQCSTAGRCSNAVGLAGCRPRIGYRNISTRSLTRGSRCKGTREIQVGKRSNHLVTQHKFGAYFLHCCMIAQRCWSCLLHASIVSSDVGTVQRASSPLNPRVTMS